MDTDITQTPGMVQVVLIDRPDVAPSGAGELALRSVAAIANAVFDATGTRLRQRPFIPARVKAALNSA